MVKLSVLGIELRLGQVPSGGRRPHRSAVIAAIESGWLGWPAGLVPSSGAAPGRLLVGAESRPGGIRSRSSPPPPGVRGGMAATSAPESSFRPTQTGCYEAVDAAPATSLRAES